MNPLDLLIIVIVKKIRKITKKLENMKKIILLLSFLIFSMVTYSQDSIVKAFCGKAVAVQYDEMKDNLVVTHHDWESVDNIYVYVDWGWGFCGISNKLLNRFIFLVQLSDEVVPEGRLIKIKCSDNNYIICVVDVLYRNDKTFNLKIIYSDLVFEYKVGYVIKGYPYYLFEKIENSKQALPTSLSLVP